MSEPLRGYEYMCSMQYTHSHQWQPGQPLGQGVHVHTFVDPPWYRSWNVYQNVQHGIHKYQRNTHQGRDESRVMEGLIRYDLTILLESNQGWELTQCWYSMHLSREDVWCVFTESFHLLLTVWPFGKLIETLNLSHCFFLDRATTNFCSLKSALYKLL